VETDPDKDKHAPTTLAASRNEVRQKHRHTDTLDLTQCGPGFNSYISPTARKQEFIATALDLYKTFTLGNYTNIIDHARNPNCNRVPVLGNMLDHDIDPNHNMVPFLDSISDHDRVSDPEMTFL